LFEITNLKHQITNKSQITNTNDLNYFDLSGIDENIFFNSFAFLQGHKVWNFEFRSLFVIWDLFFEFSLTQLLRTRLSCFYCS